MGQGCFELSEGGQVSILNCRSDALDGTALKMISEAKIKTPQKIDK